MQMFCREIRDKIQSNNSKSVRFRRFSHLGDGLCVSRFASVWWSDAVSKPTYVHSTDTHADTHTHRHTKQWPALTQHSTTSFPPTPHFSVSITKRSLPVAEAIWRENREGIVHSGSSSPPHCCWKTRQEAIWLAINRHFSSQSFSVESRNRGKIPLAAELSWRHFVVF